MLKWILSSYELFSVGCYNRSLQYQVSNSDINSSLVVVVVFVVVVVVAVAAGGGCVVVVS
jgi:hypothetical protein